MVNISFIYRVSYMSGGAYGPYLEDHPMTDVSG